MRYDEFATNIWTFGDEAKLVDQVKKHNRIFKDTLSEQKLDLADRLVRKGLLTRGRDNGRIYFECATPNTGSSATGERSTQANYQQDS